MKPENTPFGATTSDDFSPFVAPLARQAQRNDEYRVVAPRLYLDTCTLIDALLEASRASDVVGHEREIYLAQQVFAKWPPMNLIVSPYVIGEFIQKGQAKFARTLEQMREIVSKQILTDNLGLPGCVGPFGKFDVPLANSYAAAGLDAHYMMNFEFQGNAKDEAGKVFTGARVWIRALRSGRISRGIMTGLPPGSNISDIPDPDTVTFDDDAAVHVEAPAY